MGSKRGKREALSALEDVERALQVLAGADVVTRRHRSQRDEVVVGRGEGDARKRERATEARAVPGERFKIDVADPGRGGEPRGAVGVDGDGGLRRCAEQKRR